MDNQRISNLNTQEVLILIDPGYAFNENMQKIHDNWKNEIKKATQRGAHVMIIDLDSQWNTQVFDKKSISNIKVAASKSSIKNSLMQWCDELKNELGENNQIALVEKVSQSAFLNTKNMSLQMYQNLIESETSMPMYRNHYFPELMKALSRPSFVAQGNHLEKALSSIMHVPNGLIKGLSDIEQKLKEKHSFKDHLSIDEPEVVSNVSTSTSSISVQASNKKAENQINIFLNKFPLINKAIEEHFKQQTHSSFIRLKQLDDKNKSPLTILKKWQQEATFLNKYISFSIMGQSLGHCVKKSIESMLSEGFNEIKIPNTPDLIVDWVAPPPDQPAFPLIKYPHTSSSIEEFINQKFSDKVKILDYDLNKDVPNQALNNQSVQKPSKYLKF